MRVPGKLLGDGGTAGSVCTLCGGQSVRKTEKKQTNHAVISIIPNHEAYEEKMK